MKKNLVSLVFFVVLSGCVSNPQNRQGIPFAYTSVKVSGFIANMTVTEASRELVNISIQALNKEKYPDGISCVVAGSISRPELLEKKEIFKFENMSIKNAFELVANKYNMSARYENNCFIIEDLADMTNNDTCLSGENGVSSRHSTNSSKDVNKRR
jgi:hypothetical protein